MAFKYRFYPTATQQVLLHKHFGSARLVYKLALEVKTMADSQLIISCCDLIKQLPDLKKDCVWLKEVNSQSLQASRRNFLVSENQTIAIEDLNVKGMLKNHCLARSISDEGWSMFTTMLTYKCEWHVVNLLKIGRFEPSSKTYSLCGTVNQDLALRNREWRCTSCTTKYDRDLNAAENIKNFALRNYVSGTDTKTRNELPALAGVLTSKAQFIGSAVGG